MDNSLKTDIIAVKNKIETVTELRRFYKNWFSGLIHILTNKYPFIIRPRNSVPVKVNTRNEISLLTNKIYFNQLSNNNKTVIKYGGVSEVYVSDNKLYKQFKYNNEYRKELKNTMIAIKLIKTINIPEILLYYNNKKIIVYKFVPGKLVGYPFNSSDIMTLEQYKKSIKILSLIHSTYYNNFKIKLRKDIYSGKHFKSIYKFDYKNIYADYKNKLEFIHSFIGKNNKIEKVLSHGDFRPGNIIINDDMLTVIDWIDIGIRYPMYDFGSIIYGLDYNKVLELAHLYFSCRNIKYENINDFINESIAYACITHISGLIKRNDEKRIKNFIDYAYNICLIN